AREAPHTLQKRAPGGFSAPHEGQAITGLTLPQDAQAAAPERLELAEPARGQRPLVDVEGRLAAVGGIGEHVVDGEQAFGGEVRRPALVVGVRRLLAVAPVDEDEAERRAPRAGHRRRPPDDADDGVLEAGVDHRAPEEWKGVEPARAWVDQALVVVLPARLVLLGAVVMVDGEQQHTRVTSG